MSYRTLWSVVTLIFVFALVYTAFAANPVIWNAFFVIGMLALTFLAFIKYGPKKRHDREKKKLQNQNSNL